MPEIKARAQRPKPKVCLILLDIFDACLNNPVVHIYKPTSMEVSENGLKRCINIINRGSISSTVLFLLFKNWQGFKSQKEAQIITKARFASHKFKEAQSRPWLDICSPCELQAQKVLPHLSSSSDYRRHFCLVFVVEPISRPRFESTPHIFFKNPQIFFGAKWLSTTNSSFLVFRTKHNVAPWEKS